jgi:hypothetical protein
MNAVSLPDRAGRENGQFMTVDLDGLRTVQGSLETLNAFKFDEAEPTRDNVTSERVPLGNDANTLYLSKLPEGLTKTFTIRLVIDVPDEYRLLHDFRLFDHLPLV